jgi:hypothetical protein
MSRGLLDTNIIGNVTKPAPSEAQGVGALVFRH